MGWVLGRAVPLGLKNGHFQGELAWYWPGRQAPNVQNRPPQGAVGQVPHNTRRPLAQSSSHHLFSTSSSQPHPPESAEILLCNAKNCQNIKPRLMFGACELEGLWTFFYIQNHPELNSVGLGIELDLGVGLLCFGYLLGPPPEPHPASQQGGGVQPARFSPPSSNRFPSVSWCPGFSRNPHIPPWSNRTSWHTLASFLASHAAVQRFDDHLVSGHREFDDATQAVCPSLLPTPPPCCWLLRWRSRSPSTKPSLAVPLLVLPVVSPSLRSCRPPVLASRLDGLGGTTRI